NSRATRLPNHASRHQEGMEGAWSASGAAGRPALGEQSRTEGLPEGASRGSGERTGPPLPDHHPQQRPPSAAPTGRAHLPASRRALPGAAPRKPGTSSERGREDRDRPALLSPESEGAGPGPESADHRGGRPRLQSGRPAHHRGAVNALPPARPLGGKVRLQATVRPHPQLGLPPQVVGSTEARPGKPQKRNSRHGDPA